LPKDRIFTEQSPLCEALLPFFDFAVVSFRLILGRYIFLLAKTIDILYSKVWNIIV